MKRILLPALLAVSLCAQAQYYRAEGIGNDLQRERQLAASNYLDYNNLYAAFEHTFTPAPVGYQPYYVSTYARHGSRWLIDPNDYDFPLSVLRTAAAEGNLTKRGKQLLRQLEELRRLSPDDKLGVLTDVGFEQHNGIAQRMCERFPEVFDKTARIEAQSSFVPRCVKSMAEEAEVIERMSGAWVSQESGRPEWQDYLAHGSLQQEIKEALKPARPIVDSVLAARVHPERLCKQLFRKPEKIQPKDQRRFMRLVFDLAGNMQSHHYPIRLWPLFTDEECRDLWTTKNIGWYVSFAAAPQTGSIAPWRQMWLLQSFVDAADSLAGNPDFHGATLRFGHESCLMPLVALMDLGTVGACVNDLDTLDRVFRNYEIFPMAGNIQLIFYRSQEAGAPVLVKALLNEREIALPVAPVKGPYCKWDDLRAYWVERLKKYTFNGLEN